MSESSIGWLSGRERWLGKGAVEGRGRGETYKEFIGSALGGNLKS
jgi:hypothetical protein